MRVLRGSGVRWERWLSRGSSSEFISRQLRREFEKRHDIYPTKPFHVVFGLLTVEAGRFVGESAVLGLASKDEVATEGFHPFQTGVESNFR